MNMPMIEQDDDIEFEFIEVPAGEEAPKDKPDDDDNMVVSKEELRKLREAAEDRSVVKELYQGLSGQLKQQRQPINVPLAADVQTEEEFDKEVEENLFANGKTRKVIEKIIERKMAPMVGHYERTIADVQRSIASKDDHVSTIMTKYRDEFEEELARVPAVQRTTREAYEYVANKVKNNHFDDIVAEKVAEAFAKQQGEAEEVPEKQPVKRKPSTEAGRMSGSGQKKIVYKTAELKEAARRSHMTVEEYARCLEASKRG